MIGRNKKIDYNKLSRIELFKQITKEVEKEEETDNSILKNQKKIKNNLKKSHFLHL